MPAEKRIPLIPVLLLSSAGLAPACGGDAPGEIHVGLPFSFERDDEGVPVTGDERAEATDLYLDLLEKVRFFEFIDARAIGWPESDPDGGYAYGTWWSGLRIERSGRRITFRHPDDGSDNNGLRTAPLLEAVCYALALADRETDEKLTRRLIRGFNSWVMAMETASNPAAPTLLARAAYPRSITSSVGDRLVSIDYENNRPGRDADPSAYIHITDNPYWPDLWVKNKRSKDDIGHMFRAMAQVHACDANLSEATRRDLAEMNDRYARWARQVEADGFKIGTYDKNLNVIYPIESLAIFIQELDAECLASLTIRMIGRGDTGGRDCKNGITDADALASELKNNTRQIFWSFHEAAAAHAILIGEHPVAERLLRGLAERIAEVFRRLEKNDPPNMFYAPDFAALIMHAANAGLPLTSKEVRYVHDRIRLAHEGYLFRHGPDNLRHVSAFDEVAEDGEYALELTGDGLDFKILGLALGSCASAFRNPTGRALLDCDRVAERL